MDNNRNYNVYLKGMQQGKAEKLFFIDHIELDKFDTIIDFGCGDGSILAAISSLGNFSHTKFIGIDSDDYMRNLARTTVNIPNAWFFAELTREMINSNTLIIFSSVLHELNDYWTTLKRIIKGTGATLVIRDMKDGTGKFSISREYLPKLIANSNPKRLSQFLEKYGINDDSVLHYLLKYSYIDNWELELQEDYLSVPWEDIEKLGTVIYKREYILEYKKQQVKKDFDIDLEKLTKSTHCQMIIKTAFEK